MVDKVKKDRSLLFIFFLLWSLTKMSCSNIPQDPVFLEPIVYATELIFLILSALYVYKMFKWYNSPQSPPLVMAIIYFLFDFIFPLVSILIGAGIIYESRKMLKPKGNS